MRAVVVAATLGWAVLLSTPALADDRDQPHTVSYEVQVLDQATGQPLPGVSVDVSEVKRVLLCFGGDCTGPCEELQMSTSARVTTGSDGIGRVTFNLIGCELYDDDPPTWIREYHDSFGEPHLADDPAAGYPSPYVLATWSWGSGVSSQVVRVTPKATLASDFAPVLHRHDGYELQEDLGDLEETLAGHSTLEAFNVQGQRLFGPASPSPLHVWDSWHWNSFGRGGTAAYWRLDIDDSYKYAGGTPGNRPLYVHVLPYEDGAVVQYWLWFNANDLHHQWGFARHEGDWEYASIRLTFDGTRWTPVATNLSRHRGGITLAPQECWWSETNAPGYMGLEQGWSPQRSHPHFWVASNSHALYNRYDEMYTLDLNGLGSCGGVYSDAADYNLSDNPEGAHAFFPYDRLVSMGDVWHTTQAHGYTWFDHLDGGPFEPIRFYGRFGEGACDAPGGCQDGVCSIIAAFDGGTYQMSPVSPVIPEEPHNWTGFEDAPGRWGNDSSDRIGFRRVAPRFCYLGRYETCAEGTGETVEFRIPAAHPERNGLARVGVEAGDVTFLDADASGLIHLGPSVDGSYVFSTSRVGGTGRAFLDVFPLEMADELDAEHLRVDIVPGGCGTAGVEPTPSEDLPSPLLEVSPSPSAGSIRIKLGASTPDPRRIRICNVQGREMWSGVVAGNATDLTWDGRTEAGVPVPGGVYLVFEEVPGRPPRTSRVVRVK